MSSIRKMPLPFRYPGGKFYALNILKPFWYGIEHDEYREPFAGGATVFFNKPKSQNTWLNDLDDELMCCYRVLQDPEMRVRLASEFETEVASRKRWKEYFDTTPSNDYETGKKYYYLNRTSFSGKLVSAAWGYRPKRSLPPERWKERILPCGKYLEGVKLTSLDFADVVNVPGDNVLMYIDPPYYLPPKHKHYRFGFDKEDHLRLAEELKKTRHKFFLTYEDCPEIRALYSWANIYDVNFFYRVDNSAVRGGERKMGFELIISNYEPTGGFSSMSKAAAESSQISMFDLMGEK
ncbi:MAG: DNA adenine methylase [Clostridia bacterium]|nr:DNA adenine methylase [Clostridia bacterium]